MDDIKEVPKSGRTLVVCFDGTSNEYNGIETNVIKFFSLLKKDDFNKQLCYYQPGIGTWFNPGVVSPFFHWGAKVLDLAFAWYLDQHVIEGYKFLMNNYRVGDKICIFGFSRGSYTARALAGFLHKIGLLPRDNEEQIQFGYKLYKRRDRAGLDLCAGFKQSFCQDVQVEFVGVWDTVASVGVIARRTLPFTNSNKTIKTLRHALSLDERRAKFKPDFYRGEDGTDVREVWFSGCHCDVGGGDVPDTESKSLANVSLRWMVREVQTAQCGILFEETALKRFGIPRVVFRPDGENKVEVAIVSSRDADHEEELNAIDALQPMYDQLKVGSKLWWILELVPLTCTWKGEDGKRHSKLSINLGKGRTIVDQKPTFHHTVKLRMEKSKYKPNARWTAGSEEYLDSNYE